MASFSGLGQADIWGPPNLREQDERIVVHIQHRDRLSVGNLGWFLSETHRILNDLSDDESGAPTIDVAYTGSLTIAITVGSGIAAKGTWEVFKYFHSHWLERKRRDEQWAREDQQSAQENDRWEREQATQLDAAEREKRRMMDFLYQLTIRQLREDHLRLQRKAGAGLDPAIENLTVHGAGKSYEIANPPEPEDPA